MTIRLVEDMDGRVHMLVQNLYRDHFEYLPGHVDARMRRVRREIDNGAPTCLVCIHSYELRRMFAKKLIDW